MADIKIYEVETAEEYKAVRALVNAGHTKLNVIIKGDVVKWWYFQDLESKGIVKALKEGTGISPLADTEPDQQEEAEESRKASLNIPDSFPIYDTQDFPTNLDFIGFLEDELMQACRQIERLKQENDALKMSASHQKADDTDPAMNTARQVEDYKQQSKAALDQCRFAKAVILSNRAWDGQQQLNTWQQGRDPEAAAIY